MKKIFLRDSKWVDRPLSSVGCALDIGAGGFRRAENVTTLDLLPFEGTDVVHNVEEVPWPFEANSFDYVILSNVFEHIDNLHAFMKELHRVLKPGGKLRGVTPHFSNPCTYADPTHRHAVSVHVFDFYIRHHPEAAWRTIGKRLLGCDITLGSQFPQGLFELTQRSLYFREILWLTLAPIWGNVFQDFFEVYGCRLLPAWAIYFEMVAVKEGAPTK